MTSVTPTGQQSRKLRTYADQPVRRVADDALGFKAYADAFALLINDVRTATPITAAVSGPWGSGKTSLARLIEERLAVEEYWRLGWDDPPITCWFNAWLHRDATHLGAALAAAVTRKIGRERPWRWRILSPLPVAMLSPEQRWWRRLWRGVVGAAAVLLGFMALALLVPQVRPAKGPLADLFADWSSGSLWWAALPVVVALLRTGFRVTDSLGTYVDEPRSAAAQGTLAEVSDQLGRIMRQALVRGLWRRRARRRIVIFVDDLERCPPEKALDVCEVATQLLGQPEVVTILVADLDLVATAAAGRYRAAGGADAEPDQAALEVGEQYLHKLIQFRFNLPPLVRSDILSVLGRAEVPLPRRGDPA